MKKRTAKEKNKESRFAKRSVLKTVIISILIYVLFFGGILVASGYICYTKEISAERLWLCYLAASCFGSIVSIGYASSKLSIKGLITGIAYSFALTVVHSGIILACNSGNTGSHSLIILISIIVIGILSGIIGANFKKQNI